jgi:hypothetical protein
VDLGHRRLPGAVGQQVRLDQPLQRLGQRVVPGWRMLRPACGSPPVGDHGEFDMLRLYWHWYQKSNSILTKDFYLRRVM